MQSIGTATKIREFLTQYIRTDELADDTNIFSSGLVNSLFAMQLLLFIEKQFALKVENSEMQLSNFNSIDAMTAFIARKSRHAA